MRPEIREILASVRNPCRYSGGEVGSRRKPWESAAVRVCLAFPDLYELGMSHLGLPILYSILNDDPRFLAERAFMPWGDMEGELKRREMPLFSLESHRPLSSFDVLGFSLGYELTYTNVLAMLELAGVPLRSESRVTNPESRFPLVIAGGPCAYNPMPVAPFFDAIVIGDGERAVLDIAEAVAEWKTSGSPRMKLLEKLAAMRGVYVPLIRESKLETRNSEGQIDFSDSGSRIPNPVGFARVANLDSAPFPVSPVVPHTATQERLAVEVSRGCARGCRFCQAGYVYRPVRQRSGGVAARLASEGLSSTGAEEFSFLSLSIGDWAPLEGAISCVHEAAGRMPVNATLPSLRAESLTQGIIDRLGNARSGSFTLAPEAATERMRRFINKGNTDDDLYSSVEKVFASGWHAIKLYFMVGLPGETEADIDGICEIANRCLDIGRRHHRRPDVTVSTSTFIPKAHTPLQWEEQVSMERADEIQRALKKRLRRPGLYYRWHDVRMSFLEGVFSRGGAELAPVIEAAYRKGARFDGWDELFDMEIWLLSFSENGVDPHAYRRARERNEVFPWEELGAGPSRKYLLAELDRARELLSTPDCISGKCSRCGMCDFEEINNRVVVSPKIRDPISETRDPRFEDSTAEQVNQVSGLKPRVCRYRLRYTKRGRASFLGSIETLDALRRGLRSAGLPLVYSEGFHPRPRISAGPALPVGVESETEFADAEIAGEVDPSEIVQRMRGRLPDGMEVAEASQLQAGADSIEAAVCCTCYRAAFPKGGADLSEACRRFAGAGPVKFTRTRGGKSSEVDLRDYVDGLAVVEAGVLEVCVRSVSPPLKISEILGAVTGVGDEALSGARIIKTEAKLKNRPVPPVPGEAV